MAALQQASHDNNMAYLQAQNELQMIETRDISGLVIALFVSCLLLYRLMAACFFGSMFRRRLASIIVTTLLLVDLCLTFTLFEATGLPRMQLGSVHSLVALVVGQCAVGGLLFASLAGLEEPAAKELDLKP